MFDPDLYRKTCLESLRLSEEKLEEMIVMAENKKHRLRRPLQIALIAAALVCMMCVTAAAANPEAVQQLWKSFSISVLYEGPNTVVVQADIPEVSVERTGERVALMVDDVEIDITEALERDGVYKQTFAVEAGSAELTVKSDLTWEMELTMEDGKEISYSSEGISMYCPADGDENAAFTPDEDTFVTYTFTDDDNVNVATYLPPEK